MEPYSYQWILIIALVFAFLDAYGIGANDVANSFATSVGSRSLTLKKAIVIAIFTEFLGAVLLGGSTTDAVKNNIIDIKKFNKNPEVLMLGFMCALIGSSIFVVSATAINWPISTTHSIVGAIGGVGYAVFGWGGIRWETVRDILISWIAAPGLSGLTSAAIFMITKFFILNAKDSLATGIMAIPFYFLFALGITTFYVLSKAPGINWDLPKAAKAGKLGETALKIFPTTAGFALFYFLVCFFFLVPYFKRYLIEEEDLKWYHVFMPWTPKQPKNENLGRFLKGMAGDHDEKDIEGGVKETKVVEEEPEDDNVLSKLNRAKSFAFGLLTKGINTDVAAVQGANQKKVHNAAVRYDNKTEYLFSFLQICTAAFASFAHGSNDVANAAGPLSAIVELYNTGKLDSKVPVPLWILALMGIAIDIGLMTMGYKIMSVLGNNLTYHTPSRGFSMELGAALAVVTASFLGIPVSTTHCITGSTIGVGLCNGTLGAVNWFGVAWILFGWVFTLPFAGGLSAGLLTLLLKAPKF
jgi:sodium-dependent phosphate transporter